MDRRSSVRRDFMRLKTDMGLKRFEGGNSRNSYDVPFRSYNFDYDRGGSQKLLQIFWKQGSEQPLGWRSSVRRDFVHVKTIMGLERFEVAKNSYSYDFPFRSYNFEFRKKQHQSTLKLENLAAATTSLSDLTILSFEKNSSFPCLNFTINLGENTLVIPTHFC